MSNLISSRPFWAWLILFVEGLVSVSLQIIFIRQLTPFVGGDVNVVGIVIGVYLTALSLGYLRGGNEGGDIKKLSKNFLFSSFWSGIFMSYSVISLWFNSFESEVYAGVNYVVLMVYLIVGLFPVVYWLGQTVPIIVGTLKQDSASKSSGMTLGVNTIGSVLGAGCTPIVLFNLFGVAATIFICVFMLGLLYLITSYDSGDLNKPLLMVLVLSIVNAYFVNVHFSNSKFVKTNAYANYEVEKHSDGYGNHVSILRLNESAASVIANSETMGYTRYMHDFMVDQLGYVEHDILVLGSGGFTFSLNDKTDNRYTYVDIDPDIKDVAEKFFLDFNIKGTFVAEDARRYIKNKKGQFDTIIVDLYSHRLSMPWHVTTQSFMKNVSEALNQNGYAMFNVIEEMGFKHPDNRRLHNTILSVFDYCYINPLYTKSMTYANVAYICKKNDDQALEINIDDRTN